MNREVWVECKHSDWPTCLVIAHGKEIPVKRETIHESRWIPLSERMPDKADHYLVVRLGRLDWCYCEMAQRLNPNSGYVANFTSKGVTHWLEAPPLPVEDEFESKFVEILSKFEAFDFWKKTDDGLLKTLCRGFWNAAKESK